MKGKLAENFLELLKAHGLNGDTMHLEMIKRKFKEGGVKAAVDHYIKYLDTVEVKKMTPAEITAAIKMGAQVWTEEGLITKSKQKVPKLNGVLLLNENMEKLTKGLVILIPPCDQE